VDSDKESLLKNLDIFEAYLRKTRRRKFTLNLHTLLHKQSSVTRSENRRSQKNHSDESYVHNRQCDPVQNRLVIGFAFCSHFKSSRIWVGEVLRSVSINYGVVTYRSGPNTSGSCHLVSWLKCLNAKSNSDPLLPHKLKASRECSIRQRRTKFGSSSCF